MKTIMHWPYITHATIKDYYIDTYGVVTPHKAWNIIGLILNEPRFVLRLMPHRERSYITECIALYLLFT